MGNLIKFASFQFSEVNQVVRLKSNRNIMRRTSLNNQQKFYMHLRMKPELIRSNEDVYITIGKIGPLQSDSRRNVRER